ncbi:MAG: chemotaxis protein CheC [Dehalococcoidales bacterium]
MQNLTFNPVMQTIQTHKSDWIKYSNNTPALSPRQVLTSKNMAVWTGLVSRGISNALRGLSQMVGYQIMVTSPDLKWLPVKDVTNMIGGPEEVGIGIYLAIEGDATGHLLLMHDINIAFKLIDIQLGLPQGTTEHIGEMESSVLGEMGNITGSFFLNALADSGNMLLMPSPPVVMADLVRAIINIPLTLIMEEQDNALMVKATFSADSQQMDGTFMVLPTMDFMTAILDRQTT